MLFTHGSFDEICSFRLKNQSREIFQKFANFKSKFVKFCGFKCWGEGGFQWILWFSWSKSADFGCEIRKSGQNLI